MTISTVNTEAHKGNDLSDKSFKEQFKDLVDQIDNELQEIEKLFKKMESFDLDDMTKNLNTYVSIHKKQMAIKPIRNLLPQQDFLFCLR